jgi:hypothetical protein
MRVASPWRIEESGGSEDEEDEDDAEELLRPVCHELQQYAHECAGPLLKARRLNGGGRAPARGAAAASRGAPARNDAAFAGLRDRDAQEELLGLFRDARAAKEEEARDAGDDTALQESDEEDEDEEDGLFW